MQSGIANIFSLQWSCDTIMTSSKDIDIGEDVPPEVVDALLDYCRVVYMWPNRPASGGHPNDQERFRRFVELVMRTSANVDTRKLHDYLLSRGDGSRGAEAADAFVQRYNAAMKRQ